MPDLYDAVARGMWAYSKAAFRVETLGPDRFRLEPGTLIVVTHRRESDVPLICPPLYFRAALRRNAGDRMHFSARDDMFLPGFFAGFPPDLPRWIRRVLYPLGVARWLPVVQVHPIRSATVARLGEVLRTWPDAPLGELVPPDTVEAFRARAASAGRTAPVKAGEALRGDYADLLWRPVSPGDGVLNGLESFWSGRAARAAGDFRALVELMRSGGTLIVFPEGRPSPDGEIGPIRPGVGALVRRGRPERIQPMALAYDPLVRGRTKVVVALPECVSPPANDVDRALLTVMRRAMPLTAGQFAAHRLAESAEADPAALDTGLAAAVAAALREERPVERALLAADSRRRRLAEALAVAPAKPEAVSFLALEYRTARQPA